MLIKKRETMPRKMRIEACGYHHVINRGVAQSNIFNGSQDKEKFLELLGSVAKEYRFNVHAFCLMDNHYHLLIENKKENLSQGMRQLNSQYATYFNKKNKRVGHLWQGRFNSWYIQDETYLFTLFKYIEANPVKARLSRKIGEYQYSSSYCILNDGVPPFLQNSFVLRDYPTHQLFDVLQIPLSDKEEVNIDALHKPRYKIEEGELLHVKKEPLDSFFENTQNKIERNEAIQKAFKNDYSRSEIARELGLSVAGVSKILKKFKV